MDERRTPGTEIPEAGVKKSELPKPLTFEEFITMQKSVTDKEGKIIELTDGQKTQMYSAYVEMFYKDLKKEMDYWTHLYSAYVEYFYRSGADNAYNPETNPKPMSFDDFRKANQKSFDEIQSGK